MDMDNLTINTLRVLSAEAVEKASSGHPGLPLGAAPMAYTLWGKAMNHDSKNPDWINRDRFILSAGHGSALLYSLLHVFDYGVTMEDLKNFRQLGSNTPGHPEYGHTVGIETTTGPLGQGLANSVGMAMAEAHLSEKFNTEDEKIIDHYTYVICGDGDMMEGIGYEATSLAGSLGLGKLIVLYDSNSITIEGGTDLAFHEDVTGRFKAQGWETFEVEDGNDIEAIEEAVNEARKNLDKPSFIKITTEIGYGSPNKQGKSSAHGAPLGEEELQKTKEFLNWKEDEFTVPADVKEFMAKKIEDGNKKFKEWEELYESYKRNNPELAKEFESYMSLELPEDYLESDEFWNFEKDMSTREASGTVINRLSKRIPNLIGGSADLAPSNKTLMEDRGDYSSEDYRGTNLRFGVREHAMAAAGNGLYLHGGLRPYVGTFFIFTDYMKASMRLSSLMEIPVTYILTHDSIGVGEDGPTHQPIEQAAMFRALPNFNLFRPCDARETAAAWYSALKSERTPTGLALSRQGLPLLEGTGKEALKGGYVLKEETKDLELILLASGSEVKLIYEAAEKLEAKGVGTRVVSMPCIDIFEKQSDEYKEEVLPKDVTKRLAVEAASELGWYKYVGLQGDVLCMESFGASAPGDELFDKFGFTVSNVVEKALEL